MNIIIKVHEFCALSKSKDSTQFLLPYDTNLTIFLALEN